MKDSQQTLRERLNGREKITLYRNTLEKTFLGYSVLVKEIKPLEVGKNMVSELLDIKRNKMNAGPYPNVSLFESANRICSDLTIFHGCAFLFNQKPQIEYFICCFGTVQGTDIEGYNSKDERIVSAEAFCTSENMFREKVRKEINDGCSCQIFQNIDSPSISSYIQNKPDIEFIGVDITKELPKILINPN